MILSKVILHLCKVIGFSFAFEILYQLSFYITFINFRQNHSFNDVCFSLIGKHIILNCL